MSTLAELERAMTAPPGDLAAARRIARRFGDLDAGDVDTLLWTGERKARLVAVLILLQRFRDGSADARASIVEQYLAAARGERLDDRLVVDVSAEHIVGEWYADRSPNPLFALAKSDVVWERRIAVLATLAFVKRGDATTALDLVGRLLRERSEDIQTAVGLVLRETGKRADHDALIAFLDGNAPRLGRTALAIATERLSPQERDRYRTS